MVRTGGTGACGTLGYTVIADIATRLAKFIGYDDQLPKTYLLEALSC